MSFTQFYALKKIWSLYLRESLGETDPKFKAPPCRFFLENTFEKKTHLSFPILLKTLCDVNLFNIARGVGWKA